MAIFYIETYQHYYFERTYHHCDDENPPMYTGRFKY